MHTLWLSPALLAMLAGPLSDTADEQAIAPNLTDAQTEVLAIREDQHNRYTVPVTIDGAGPFHFMIDTGSQGTAITDAVHAQLSLAPAGTATVVGTASRKQVNLVEVESLGLGFRTIYDIEAPVLMKDHVGADGIIGLDTLQLAIIGFVTLVVMTLKWKDFMVTFFDESHARSIGLNPLWLKLLFFTLLSASTVAALQTVGAFLVVAMVVTPGAIAYLLTDRFQRLILIAALLGAGTSFAGAYISYFLDGATGGVIVVLQTAIFLLAFVFAPKHGYLASRRKRRLALEPQGDEA